jgi:ferric-dicitrate binding protein FerR (iron transport regulator)
MNAKEDQVENDAVRALLRELEEPPAAMASRVAERLASSAPRGASHRHAAWMFGAGVGALAMAAGALLFFSTPEKLGTPPHLPVSAALAASADWQTVESLDGVNLTWKGVGTVSGTADAPLVAWESGSINVEVTPERGIKLAVETREAMVRVVGTGFTVTRDALGTHVSVRHGKVEVTCASAVPVMLGAGEGAGCLPDTPAGLLLRARALAEQKAPVAEILASLDRGLAVAPPGNLADELLATRISTLAEAGRHAEALESARRYLTNPEAVRRDEVQRLADALAPSPGPAP